MLYKVPEELRGHDIAYDNIPSLPWGRYRWDTVELKKREHLWAKFAMYSYLYAKNIIYNRFLEGEPAIATDAELSYLYANNVINGRFLEGEPAIEKNKFYSELYKQDLLEL